MHIFLDFLAAMPKDFFDFPTLLICSRSKVIVFRKIPLPKKLHITSIFHDRSKYEVRIDLSRLENSRFFNNSNTFLIMLYKHSLILMYRGVKRPTLMLILD
jgi:hypothetical protein